MVQFVAVSLTHPAAESGSTVTVMLGFNQMLKIDSLGTSSKNKLSPICTNHRPGGQPTGLVVNPLQPTVRVHTDQPIVYVCIRGFCIFT
jgi:hypothetical protein